MDFGSLHMYQCMMKSAILTWTGIWEAPFLPGNSGNNPSSLQRRREVNIGSRGHSGQPDEDCDRKSPFISCFGQTTK